MEKSHLRFLAVYQDTSRDAWESVQEILGAIDAQIVEFIRSNDGAISDEIEAAIPTLKHQTVSAQIRHMAEAGLLIDSGQRRPTRSGRDAIVWIIVPRYWQKTSQGTLFTLFR